MEKHNLSIQSNLNQVSDVYHFVESVALKHNVDDKMIYDLKLAIEEILTNVIVHGYKDQSGEISVEVVYDKNIFTIIIEDTAPLYDPTKTPEPDMSIPIDKRKPGGFGVFLAMHSMDAINHSPRASGGNKVVMTKKVV